MVMDNQKDLIDVEVELTPLAVMQGNLFFLKLLL